MNRRGEAKNLRERDRTVLRLDRNTGIEDKIAVSKEDTGLISISIEKIELNMTGIPKQLSSNLIQSNPIQFNPKAFQLSVDWPRLLFAALAIPSHSLVFSRNMQMRI
uniref:Uncharacterized protein n=1 Tax=Vespula pensylvanica TaxID=30213 RepID=A0A834P4U3_VESPE|nr:hypothetical protein H0235_005526 [Vespula pensylvanica]